MNQKGFNAVFILIGVLVIAGLIGGAFYFGKAIFRPKPENSVVSSQTFVPLPSVSTNTNEVAGRKTYSSNGVSFQYPSTWEVKSQDNIVDPSGLYSLSLANEINYNKETKKPFENLLEYEGLSSGSVTVIVDGQKAIQVLPRAGSENSNSIDVFSKDFKQIYTLILTMNAQEDDSKIKEGQKLFSQILSSFKFLDQNQPDETVNWKTYTNNELKISFKYPLIFILKSNNKSMFDSTDFDNQKVSVTQYFFAFTTGKMLNGEIVGDSRFKGEWQDESSFGVNVIPTNGKNIMQAYDNKRGIGDEITKVIILDKIGNADEVAKVSGIQSHIRVYRKGNYFFEIISPQSNAVLPDKSDDILTYINQILSTFKFTN